MYKNNGYIKLSNKANNRFLIRKRCCNSQLWKFNTFFVFGTYRCLPFQFVV